MAFLALGWTAFTAGGGTAMNKSKRTCPGSGGSGLVPVPGAAALGQASVVLAGRGLRASRKTRGGRGKCALRMCERRKNGSDEDGASERGGMDDAQLNKALQDKIDQYFGAQQQGQNSQRQAQKDPQQPTGYFVSAAESEDTFQSRLEIVARKERRRKAAEGVIKFVAGISVASGLIFSLLFYAIRAPEESYYQGQSGFVHGGTRKSTAFQPPRYGTETEIDPYALLKSESSDMEFYSPQKQQK